MKNDSVNNSLDDYDFSILRTKNSPVVTSLYKLQDGRVAFSSANNTITIVSIDEYHNMTFAQVLNEHSQGVEDVSQLKNGKLISCSFDHSIKIWKCDKLQFSLEHSIENAHDQPIHKVIPLSNERMASCSDDSKIKIWNSNPPYNLIKILQDNVDNIKSIIQSNNKELLLSTTANNLINIWNLTTYMKETTITDIEHGYHNSLIQIDDNRLVVGGRDKITVVSLKYYSIIKIIDESHLYYVDTVIYLGNDIVLCGNGEGGLILIDIQSEESKIVQKAQNSASDIFGLINIDEGRVMSGSWNRTLTLWSY